MKALRGYEAKLSTAYGSNDDEWVVLDLTGVWPTARGTAAPTVEQLVSKVLERVDARFAA